MGDKMKRLCAICARAGSQGVKNKNVREIAGKPLIAHTILQAQASTLFSVITVSSDSQAILDVARQFGVDSLILRPPEMATAFVSKLPAIQHAVKVTEENTKQQFSTIVDLDVTSPLRFVDDICEAVELLEQTGASNLFSVTPARRSPYFNLVEIDENGVPHLSKSLKQAVVRRQDSPKCYDMNASIYVWQKENLLNQDDLFTDKTKIYIMPEERSIDIDTALDFELVNYLLNKRREHHA